MWVARDKDNSLYLYNTKPYKRGTIWETDNACMYVSENLFPEIKWEDEEPLEVEIVPKGSAKIIQDSLERFVIENLDKEVTVNLSGTNITGPIVGYCSKLDYVILEMQGNKTGWSQVNVDDTILSTNLKTYRFWYVKLKAVKAAL